MHEIKRKFYAWIFIFILFLLMVAGLLWLAHYGSQQQSIYHRAPRALSKLAIVAFLYERLLVSIKLQHEFSALLQSRRSWWNKTQVANVFVTLDGDAIPSKPKHRDAYHKFVESQIQILPLKMFLLFQVDLGWLKDESCEFKTNCGNVNYGYITKPWF